MAKPIIAILGLGLRGASMGLALQREEATFEIVGHDRDPQATQAAKRSGAVHRTEWNLHNACEGADMIVLALPFAELEEMLGHIAEDLKPGALVFALVSLMQPTIDLADRLLPSHAHFVVGRPVLSGVGGQLEQRADLFEEIVFALAPGLQTEADAVQLASDYVERVGATPFFVDAAEHDGIVAGVEQLPQLLAAILMRQASAAPGWREARRLAGRQFAHATELGQSAEQILAALEPNRANLLHRLRALHTEMEAWMQWLAGEPGSAARSATAGPAGGSAAESPAGQLPAGEAAAPTNGHVGRKATDKDGDTAADPLLKALTEATRARADWETSAILKKWEELPQNDAPKSGESGFLRQMFFGNLMGRRGGDSRDRSDKR
ncbi:MAG: prephenate dehydrogenase/arogenate dehydrogenase family protein [Litorilinea sp.]